MGPFEGASKEQLEKQINTNFLGTILVTKSFLPYFRKRKRNGTDGFSGWGLCSFYHERWGNRVFKGIGGKLSGKQKP